MSDLVAASLVNCPFYLFIKTDKFSKNFPRVRMFLPALNGIKSAMLNYFNFLDLSSECQQLFPDEEFFP